MKSRLMNNVKCTSKKFQNNKMMTIDHDLFCIKLHFETIYKYLRWKDWHLIVDGTSQVFVKLLRISFCSIKGSVIRISNIGYQTTFNFKLWFWILFYGCKLLLKAKYKSRHQSLPVVLVNFHNLPTH